MSPVTTSPKPPADAVQSRDAEALSPQGVAPVADVGRADVGRADVGRADVGRADVGRADGVGAGLGAAAPVPSSTPGLSRPPSASNLGKVDLEMANLEKANPFSTRRPSSTRLRGLDPEQVLV